MTGHPVHPIPFVFLQKTDKFQFVMNDTRTIRRWRSTYSQSHPHYAHLVCELCVPGLMITEWIDISFNGRFIRGPYPWKLLCKLLNNFTVRFFTEITFNNEHATLRIKAHCIRFRTQTC